MDEMIGCPEWDQHEFAEVYYGYKCRKCALFYAFGCAPWEDEEAGKEAGNGRGLIPEAK